MSGGRDDLMDFDVTEEDTSTEEVVEEIPNDEVETSEETSEETPEEVDPKDTEIAQLRSMLSTQHSTIKQFKAKQDEFEKRLKGEIADPEDEEALNDKLDAHIAARNDELDTFLEVMRVSPKYEDVDAICSQTNVDKLIHTLASMYVAEKGGDILEAMDGIAGELWSKKNPYTTLYAMVKEHVLVSPAAPTAAKKLSKTGIKPGADAPASLGGLPAGSSNVSGGWTAERIDGLPESELHTVPHDVYTKYLQGTLN